MLEQLYNAIFVGSIYALFAVGFALVFSVLDILNLAHPVVFMLGAFVALFFMSTFGLPAALAAVAAFAVTGMFGIFLDRVAFAPLRRRGAPPLSAMISSLGFAIVVIRLMELRYGPDLTSYPAGSLPQTVLQLGDARVDGLRLLIIGLAILLIAALVFLPAELAELRDAFAFGLLFLVLVIRPRGLLGHRAVERA